MNIALDGKVKFEDDLRCAVKRNEFQVYYQPKLDLVTKRVVGMEALVRWAHPTDGLIPPLNFIRIAEEIGVIGDITHFVLRSAIKQLSCWQSMGHRISVAINISPYDFHSGNIDALLAGALYETDCNPEDLEFEITESSLLLDNALVSQSIQRVKALGIKLSIDDFGSGYCNFSYLQRFPLDCIKIDHAFIADSESRSILKTIIDLCRSLSLTTVVEGVETHDQLSWLTRQRCDQVQGYLFSKPVDAKAATRYLTERSVTKCVLAHNY